METLAQKDVRRLFESLLELYAFRNHQNFVRHLLTHLPSLLPCEIIAYNEFDLRQPDSVHSEWLPSEGIPADLLPTFQARCHENPIVHYYKQTGDGRAFKVSDFLSRPSFHDLGIYNDFYRPCRVEHQIATALHISSTHVVSLALCRPRQDFTERDRLLLNLIRPHVIQAFHNAELVTQTESRIGALTRGTEEAGSGVLEVSLRGRIIWATPRAMNTLAEFWSSDATAGTDTLPPSLAAWVQRSEAEFADPTNIPRPQLPFVMRRNGNTLTIRLVRKPHRRLLYFEQRLEEPSAETLALLGLGRRQCEVLALVARGKTNAEIAALLGLSIKTVKKHMEQIFQRLGVETRTAAAARASECWRSRPQLS